METSYFSRLIIAKLSFLLVLFSLSSLASVPTYIEKLNYFSVDGDSIVYQGKLYFPGRDEAHGTELWVYDKKTGQAELVADTVEGTGSLAPRKFIEYKGKLYFESSSNGLYSLDGKTQQITEFKDTWGRSFRILNTPKLMVYNGKLYFFTYSGLHSLDGDTNTITGVASFDRHNCHMMSCDVVFYDDKLFFVSKIPNTSNGSQYGNLELYSFDSKTNTGQLIADIRPGKEHSSIQKLTVFRNKLYFAANDGVHGIELWSHDSKTGQTAMVADINPGALSGGFGGGTTSIYDGDLYFSARDEAHGTELWKLEGDTGNVTLVADIIPGEGSGSPNHFAIHNGKLYFSAEYYSGNRNDFLHSFSSKTNTVSRAQANAPTKDQYVQMMQSINGLLYVTSRGSRPTTFGWYEGVWAYNDVTDSMTEIHTNGRKTSSATGGTFYRSWFTDYLGSIFYGATDKYRNSDTGTHKRITGFYQVDLTVNSASPLIPEMTSDL